MDKKELKFYDVPTCEVVELKASAALMVTSPGGDGQPGGGTDLDEDEDLV